MRNYSSMTLLLLLLLLLVLRCRAGCRDELESKGAVAVGKMNDRILLLAEQSRSSGV